MCLQAKAEDLIGPRTIPITIHFPRAKTIRAQDRTRSARSVLKYANIEYNTAMARSYFGGES